MLEGYWREFWPLIVLAHAPEILSLLGAVALLALTVWWGVRLKRWRAKP